MLSIIVNSTFDKIVMKDFSQGLFETKKKLKNFENKIAKLLFDAGLKKEQGLVFKDLFPSIVSLVEVFVELKMPNKN